MLPFIRTTDTLKYKSYRATCYVTNSCLELDTRKLMRSETCQNASFTWLEHTRPSTKSHAIIGYHTRSSYWDNVTVYPYNGYIQSTNPIVRHVMSLTCTLKQILVNYGTQNHAKKQPKHQPRISYDKICAFNSCASASVPVPIAKRTCSIQLQHDRKMGLKCLNLIIRGQNSLAQAMTMTRVQVHSLS